MKPTVHEQIKELFQSVRMRALTVRQVIYNLPKLNRATVSKECLYMATLGMLATAMVGNWGEGHRSHYEFTSTPLLLSKKHVEAGGSPRSLILAVMKEAPAGLSVNDLRYAINSLFDVRLAKRAIQSAVDQLITGGLARLDHGDAPFRRRLNQRYTLGRASSAPWCVLDSAFRKMESCRQEPRRLISQGSAIRRRTDRRSTG